jgi:hypothetical protein
MEYKKYIKRKYKFSPRVMKEQRRLLKEEEKKLSRKLTTNAIVENNTTRTVTSTTIHFAICDDDKRFCCDMYIHTKIHNGDVMCGGGLEWLGMREVCNYIQRRPHSDARARTFFIISSANFFFRLRTKCGLPSTTTSHN